jgi:hypothetical protein
LIRASVVSGLAIVLSFGAAGCASQPEPAPEQKKHAEILSMQLPADVSAPGVVLAALLLTTSDIEAALAEGIVTPAEVTLAQAAIDDGLLDHWRQRAEQEIRN